MNGCVFQLFVDDSHLGPGSVDLGSSGLDGLFVSFEIQAKCLSYLDPGLGASYLGPG